MISLLGKLFDLIKSRLAISFLTLPSNEDWVGTTLLLIIFSLIVIPLGLKLKFLRIEIPKISSKALVRLVLMTLFLPAALEEVFFRVLLLPHKSEQVSLSNQFFLIIVSLVLFIVSHPLNAIFFRRNAKTTFNSFAFLTFAAILGVVCTIAYLKSGSIYPPIILHWIFVLGWLLGFGGYQRLYQEANNFGE